MKRIYCFLIFLACFMTADAFAASKESSQLQPSAPFEFDFTEDQELSEYIEYTKTYLATHHVFSGDNYTREESLQMITPRFYQPQTSCGKTNKGSILLIHGLLETAYGLSDIAKHLSSLCFTAFTLLLPGHGTKPGDLLNTTKEQWLNAANYAVTRLKKNHNLKGVVGFSLGGLITLNLATSHPDLPRVVALSPALNISSAGLAMHTIWLRYLKSWLSQSPQQAPMRYSSMTYNSVAETYLISKKTQDNIQKNGLTPPALIIQSHDESTIDPKANLEFFKKYFKGPHKLIQYGGASNHPNVVIRPSRYDSLKVLNYSHLSIPFHPSNPIFGKEGKFKECGLHWDSIAPSMATKCLQSNSNWKGEMGSSKSKKYLPLQRLTYNPDFDFMMQEIGNWFE